MPLSKKGRPRSSRDRLGCKMMQLLHALRCALSRTGLRQQGAAQCAPRFVQL